MLSACCSKYGVSYCLLRVLCTLIFIIRNARCVACAMWFAYVLLCMWCVVRCVLYFVWFVLCCALFVGLSFDVSFACRVLCVDGVVRKCVVCLMCCVVCGT